MLLISTQSVCAEEPIRIHCLGDGTRTFKDVGSENISVEKYYEFYKDRMTETVSSTTLKYTKEEITKKTDDNYGLYKIDTDKIFVLHDSKIKSNDGSLLSQQRNQISIDRNTGNWDFMLTSSGILMSPESTILIHGICEPWKLEKKF